MSSRPLQAVRVQEEVTPRPSLPSKRRNAIVRLGSSNTPAARRALRRLLQTAESSTERAAAALQLGRSSDPTSTRSLLQALRDPSRTVRCAAAGSLRWDSRPEVCDALAAVLADSSEYASVRSIAAESLGELGCRRAANALLRALQDPSPRVRLAAAFAVGNLKLLAARAPLRRLLADRTRVARHGSVAATAARALAQIGT